MVRIAAETPWYDLFSRGARDWLRHNQKVREAVKNTLPEILSGEDLMTGSGKNRTVMVPTHPLHTEAEIADTIHNIEVAARVALGGMTREEADIRNAPPVDAQKFDLEESVHA